jgi:hypothetical protein
MPLTSKQRNKLPDSAFAYPGKRKYPVPTKKQAAKAGIGEKQRQRTLRNALSRAAQKNTAGSTRKVKAVVAKRAAGTVKSVRRGGGRKR